MHISDIRKYNRCHQLYWLSRQNEGSRFPYFNITEDICESISRKLDIEWYNTGSPNQTNDDSLKLLESSPWLFRAWELKAQCALICEPPTSTTRLSQSSSLY